MAPSAPVVAALFRLAAAWDDENSMLQMPELKKTDDTLTSDCACPGFFEQDCLDNAFQGCVWTKNNIGSHPLGWTDVGMNSRTGEETTGPWCQCDPNFVKPDGPLFPTPEPTPVLSCPVGWEQRGTLGADIGGCGLQSCDQRYDLASEVECASRCSSTDGCVAFSWAPMNGDRNHPGVTACTIYNSAEPNGLWTGTDGEYSQLFCAESLPFPGGWIDPTGSFYGGAVIRLGSACSVENPSQEVWQTASYECELTADGWDFIETRAADGATHHHIMELQDDGNLRVTKGSIVWTLQPQFGQ